MPDLPLVPDGVVETVLEATLNELGGEPVDGSGFEDEVPIELDVEPPEEDAQ